MDNIYPTLKENINQRLLFEVSKNTMFSTTTDIWTADHLRVGFMAITIHYIDVDWNMKTLLICFEEINVPHSGANIALVYKKAVEEFGIQNNILSCTLDNASNNTNFVSVIKTDIDTKLNFLCDGEFFHSRCNGHIVNLIAQDGLAILKKDLTALRLIKITLT